MPTPGELSLAPLRAALRSALRRSAEANYQHHVEAVLLVALGHPCGQVGQWLGCSPRSIERWLQAYRLRGCEGLRVTPGGGRPTRLSLQQWAQLRQELATPPVDQGFSQLHWCGKLLATHLERRYGLAMSLRQAQRLLRSCQREARPIPTPGGRQPMRRSSTARTARSGR
jgi:transposase